MLNAQLQLVLGLALPSQPSSAGTIISHRNVKPHIHEGIDPIA